MSEHPSARCSFDDLGEFIEAGGEPLHHGGELEDDEVAYRRLPDRATLLPELVVELVEGGGRDSDRPALSHPRWSETTYHAVP
jgi:hypothetical protein